MISLVVAIYLLYGCATCLNAHQKNESIIGLIFALPIYALLWLPLWLWARAREA